MKFENTQVFNIEGAIRGMKFPMKSTSFTTGNEIDTRDLLVANKLVHAGIEDNAAHCKFLRQILISVDITAPRYWWSEFDTYKVGTTADSESTMHKILKDADNLTLADFQVDKPFEGYIQQAINTLKAIAKDERFDEIEKLRGVKQILPESFLQKRHITMNYEVVRNMVKQRRHHRLTEWKRDFTKWVQAELPYSDLFIYGIRSL